MNNEEAIYLVVVNKQEQYSIWPADREAELPNGWQREGFSGSKNECLEYIYALWTNWRSKGDIIELE